MSERLYTLEEVRQILEAHENVVEAKQGLDNAMRYGGFDKEATHDLQIAKENRAKTWKSLEFSIPHWDICE